MSGFQPCTLHMQLYLDTYTKCPTMPCIYDCTGRRSILLEMPCLCFFGRCSTYACNVTLLLCQLHPLFCVWKHSYTWMGATLKCSVPIILLACWCHALTGVCLCGGDVQNSISRVFMLSNFCCRAVHRMLRFYMWYLKFVTAAYMHVRKYCIYCTWCVVLMCVTLLCEKNH